MPGIPRRGAAGDAAPHVRLRPRRVEPHPGGTARPLAAEGKSTSYAETDRALTAMKKDPGLAFLNEVSSVPLQQALRHQHAAFGAFFARRARYPRFKSRAGRQSAHYTRSAFALRGGVLRLAKTATPLRFAWSWPEVDVTALDPAMVIVSPGAGRPLVRDLHRRHGRPGAAAGDRPRRRRGPRREGLRRHLRRGADRQPAAPGRARPGTWPATSGAWPAARKAPRTGPRRRRRWPAPTARSATPGATSCTAPAPGWSASTT